MNRSWREQLDERFNQFCRNANLTEEQRQELVALLEEERELSYERGQDNVHEAYNY
jgi:Spy/CpxP family protein refolding chaperone